MDLVNEHYEELVNFIIRPPRRTYKDYELGNKYFQLDDELYQRVDFEVINKRGQKIQCSQYYKLKHRKKMPVVIYCHGNSGCRLDAMEALRHLLKMELSVVCFDFSGSGNSEGDYVSLGYYEQDDLEAVVGYLRKNDQTTRIGLWGRSMGAATSLMFGVTDPSVACMVLDSPFSSLKVLANELVTKNEVKLPKMVVTMAFKMIKKSIQKQAGFDIEKLEPIKSAPKCFIPALFAHATDDDFIDMSHSKNLSEKYAGDFNLINFDGDHLSQRPSFFYDSVCIFFENNLNVTFDFGDDNPYVVDEGPNGEEVPIGIRGAPKSYGSNMMDDLERAKQLSLQEEFKVPKSQEEEDELLDLVLKMSLMEAEAEKNTTKEENPPPKDNKEQVKHQDPVPPPSKLKGSKKVKADEKVVALEEGDKDNSKDSSKNSNKDGKKGGKKSTTKKKK